MTAVGSQLLAAPPALDRDADATPMATCSAPQRGSAAAAEVAAPPVILIGGEANALSVARELGRQGIKVYGIGPRDTCVHHSRYCEWIDVAPGEIGERELAEFLLGPDARRLHGAVVLACSDAGLQVLAHHREQLLSLYRLDLAHPPAQLAMLDKLQTYELARAAGVTTPLFWAVSSADQVRALRDELVFPLMVKPRLSHLFEQHFGRKHIVVDTFDQLVAAFAVAEGAGLSVLLVEHIPGGDDELCSYYTYVDAGGAPLCHYTKRIIRRFPVGMGAACYHVTGDVPEIVEPSLKLLAHAGVRGLANIEFKRDPRDGRHKLIECNARFTASNSLVAASGLRLASFVYARAAGRPAELIYHRRRPMRLWDPVRDFAAFLQLRREGKLTLWRWLLSVAHRQRFPYFSWSDTGPTRARFLKAGRRAIFGRAGKR